MVVLFFTTALVLLGSHSKDVLADTISVSIPFGTTVPVCEETNSCFIPFKVVIKPQDTVKWTNNDIALHVVWSGNPQEGPNGIFDSPLIFANEMFSHTFDEAGIFPYFDPLHPWMTGVVVVLQPVGGELIPLDSTMILAAGAQYTAAWMIPVIVSGIGIGIVIARKF